MKLNAAMAACAVLATGVVPQTAFAQAAAETATILSGTGQATGAASQSLGSAINRSIGNAASAVHAANQRSGRGSVQVQQRQPAGQGAQVVAGVDSLEGTDAAGYELGNGARIRVSGTLRPSRQTTCVENCSGQDTP